jgi:hypothetical protein
MKCANCQRTFSGIDYCPICSNPSEGRWQMLRADSPSEAHNVAQLRSDAEIVQRMLELGDARLLASDGPAGGQLPDLSPDEWSKVYRACKRIAERATKYLPSAIAPSPGFQEWWKANAGQWYVAERVPTKGWMVDVARAAWNAAAPLPATQRSEQFDLGYAAALALTTPVLADKCKRDGCQYAAPLSETQAGGTAKALIAPRGHDEAHERINQCFREIEIICDTFGYDPAQWLVIDDGDMASPQSGNSRESGGANGA